VSILLKNSFIERLSRRDSSHRRHDQRDESEEGVKELSKEAGAGLGSTGLGRRECTP
jgi:hypothetical protein